MMGAVLRGVLVSLLVATPSLLLPGNVSHAPEMIALLAILAGVLTFAEYNSSFPSFVEFRDAPPINRMRFVALAVMIIFLTMMCKHKASPTNMTAIFTGLGALIGNMMDFPYSPAKLVVLMLPDDAPIRALVSVRMAAGVTYLISLVAMASFFLAIRVQGWPVGNGAFNVWVNLPLFDPTTGGDVVYRLQRDGRVNVIAGILLPFVIPALIKVLSSPLTLPILSDPQTLIWSMSAWAFLPASMVMRGMAMLRIADLIEEKRRRAYANAEALQTA